MNKLIDLIKQCLPSRFRPRRYPVTDDTFELTTFEGDIEQWLQNYPVCQTNVDIYYNLAELFRRRGEFDKAISIHQAISLAKLEGHEPFKLAIEIAHDYYSAGVLSHAEDMLVGALDEADDQTSRQAFRLWLAILEKEKDWHRAIELIEKHGTPGSGGLRLANLYCQYAIELEQRGDYAESASLLTKAMRIEGCRALFLSGLWQERHGKQVLAFQHYVAVLKNNPLRADLVVLPLQQLALELGRQAELLTLFAELYQRQPSVRFVESVIELCRLSHQPVSESWSAAIRQQAHLGRSTIVSRYWLEQNADCSETTLALVDSVLASADLSTTEYYVCAQCGRAVEKLLWQCPQCEAWETIYSSYELKLSSSSTQSL